MIGTNAAKTPKNPKRLSSDLKALMALRPVLRPIEISVIINANPNVTARIRYTNKKDPPPYFAARYGKRHKFPRPTAEPDAASTNPILLVKLLLLLILKPPKVIDFLIIPLNIRARSKNYILLLHVQTLFSSKLVAC